MKKIKTMLALLAAGTMMMAGTLTVSAAEISDIFNADFYAGMNPDVKASVGTDPVALYNHYITSGIAEGRVGSVMFDVEEYKTNNPDLAKQLGYDNMALTRHYAENGRAEGRDGGGLFDPIAYAEAYSDVKAIYGSDVKAICEHFLTKGLDEGRTKGLKFNAICYAALNPDLARQYKDNEVLLFRQYINGGRAEGRLGAKPNRVYEPMVCTKLGKHNVTDWEVVLKVTCTEPGFEVGHCNVCGERVQSMSERMEEDGGAHVDYNEDMKCDICGARNESGKFRLRFYH